MANYNIQMNMLNSSGGYDVLYPQTLGSQVSGSVSNADTASTLSSTLSVSKGGTGVTSYSSLASKLQSYLSSGLSQSEVEALIGQKAVKKLTFSTVALSTSWAVLPWTIGVTPMSFLILQANGNVIISMSETTTNNRDFYLGHSMVFIQNDRANGMFSLLNPSVNGSTVSYLTDFYITNNSKAKVSSGTLTLNVYEYY